MNPTKKILLLDDEPQGNSLEKIANGLKGKLVIESKQIEVLDTEYLDREANLVPEKVFQAIDRALKDAQYDLVLVDYSYGQDGFDGLDVIKHIREKHQKDEVFLYSANQKEIIRKVVGDNLKDSSPEDIINGINELINFRIAKIVSRPAMDAEVIGYLKKDIEISPYGFIVNVLREHPNKIFSSCYPKLSGKTYGEIADLLDEGGNGMANEWLCAILEQLVVYLSEVNE